MTRQVGIDPALIEELTDAVDELGGKVIDIGDTHRPTMIWFPLEKRAMAHRLGGAAMDMLSGYRVRIRTDEDDGVFVSFKPE
jgi:hypothetical protein